MQDCFEWSLSHFVLLAATELNHLSMLSVLQLKHAGNSDSQLKIDDIETSLTLPKSMLETHDCVHFSWHQILSIAVSLHQLWLTTFQHRRNI